MKTIPKVGEIVYRHTGDGGLYKMLITHDYGDGFLNVTHMDQHITGISNEKLHHKYFQGRIVKKPRKCEECAKPKKLFYFGHDRPSFIGTDVYIRGSSPRTSAYPYEYVSTLALISTEEVKK